MELAIMHIDNRVESLEEARNCLDFVMCNNQYVYILLTKFLKVGVLINFLFSLFLQRLWNKPRCHWQSDRTGYGKKNILLSISRLDKYRN